MKMKPSVLLSLTCMLFSTATTAGAQTTSDSLLVRYRLMALEYDDDLKAATRRVEACAELERAARATDFRPSRPEAMSATREIHWNIRHNCRKSDR